MVGSVKVPSMITQLRPHIIGQHCKLYTFLTNRLQVGQPLTLEKKYIGNPK